MKLNGFQIKLNEESPYEFSGLRALFINCTLKKSPETSHTQGLMNMIRAIMEANGVSTEMIRAVDHRIAFGVYPDMKDHGWDGDDWPIIQEKVMQAHILVVAPLFGLEKNPL